MKVVVSQEAITGLIGKIQGVINPKNAQSILNNLLIEAVADQLIVSGTDLSLSMRAYIDAKVLEEGAIALPAKRCFQLIRELTAPQAEIHSTSGEIAYINSGTSRFKIQGVHASEFPELPDLSGGVRLAIPSHLLKEMLTRSAFAAARDKEQKPLNGILLQGMENRVIFMATDGKSLAQLSTSIDLPAAYRNAFILPLKAADEMIKILDEKEPEATLTLMEDKISLDTGSVTLIATLLSGDYPDVARVIPKKSGEGIALHREELISLLRQVSLFIDEKSNSVRFSFMPGELHLSAADGKVGEGKVSMPINYGGPKVDVAFNPYYFIDILRHIKDETADFWIADSYNPGLITDSTSALFVIMPMRLY